MAVYFNLKPFNEQETQDAEDDMSPASRAKTSHFGPLKRADRERVDSNPTSSSWLMTVEDVFEIQETTSYLSIRLMESANPYVEGLQRDEQVGVFLGMMSVFWAAAVFQPAMMAHQTRALVQKRVCMSVKELLKLINEHFVEPVNRKIGLFLWISFDWLGNPSKLFFGILAGFRELFMQPYRKGLRGIPRGIEVCLCSVFGSLFDSLARILFSLFKGIDRALRMVHTRVGVKNVRQGNLILSLSRTPVGKRDGFRRGTLLALLQCRTVFLNMREIFQLFVSRGKKEYRGICVYVFVFGLTMVLTLCLGIIEAILLFVYNVLQGLVVSLYKKSAEEVCDWDPIQLVALEMPVSVRPPLREMRHTGEGGSGIVTPPFAYLPALVHSQLDPDEGLVPPWQWQRWSSGDEADEVVVISAIWCRGADARKVLRKGNKDKTATIFYETEISVALLQVSDFCDVTARGRPRKPRARFETLWTIEKSDLRSIGVQRGDSELLLLRFEGISGSNKIIKFASDGEAFRTFELIAPLFVDDFNCVDRT